MRSLLALLLAAACSASVDDTPGDAPSGDDGDGVSSGDDTARPAADDSGDGVAGGDCAYPDGAVEPMALGEVLTPYRWPEAIHGDGRVADLDLGLVPCAADPDIDWSPFDVLLFVSIPAW